MMLYGGDPLTNSIRPDAEVPCDKHAEFATAALDYPLIVNSNSDGVVRSQGSGFVEEFMAPSQLEAHSSDVLAEKGDAVSADSHQFIVVEARPLPVRRMQRRVLGRLGRYARVGGCMRRRVSNMICLVRPLVRMVYSSNTVCFHTTPPSPCACCLLMCWYACMCV